MTGPTRFDRVRARFERLPAAWIVVAVGFLLQVGLAVGQFTLVFEDGSRIRAIGAGLRIGIVAASGVVALPVFVLLLVGRLRRTAGALACLVAGVTLVVAGTQWLLWVFPATLVVAAVRAWAGAGLDAADLLELDLSRFERVDPPAVEVDEGGDTVDETDVSS